MTLTLRAPSFFLPLLLLCACAPDSPTQPADAAPAAAGKPTAAAPAAGCELVMGWDAWEPYHYRDVGGNVHGLDVELVTAMANSLGCTLSFDQEDWSTLLARLRDGEIDLLSGATKTAPREEFAWFSEPYRAESFQLYVRSGETDEFTGDSLEALLDQGMTVGTTLDYVYGAEVAGLQDNIEYGDQFRGAAVGELNYDRLLQFQIDSFLEDPFVAATIIRRKGLEEKIAAHALIVRTGTVHLMFSKESVDRAMVDRFNAELGRMRESGEYQRIVDRYL